MKTKIRAIATIFLITACLSGLPAVLPQAAASQECAVVGCPDWVSIGGSVLVGLLLIWATPVAGIAGGAVFGA